MTTFPPWRVLIVDDRQAEDVRELICGPGVFQDPDAVECRTCDRFSDALRLLETERLDLVILDLRDDSIQLEDEHELPGLRVFREIKDRRFLPVVFFTAYPKYVEGLENPFVRVVRRDAPRDLRSAVQDVLESGLPYLVRHIEQEQRAYMWEFVEAHWKDLRTSPEKTDLTFLLARRLASVLSRSGVRRFLELRGHIARGAGEHLNIYPIEMYVMPPASPILLAGDLVKTKIAKRDGYWIVLTPSCDFEQEKAERILLAGCALLSEQPECRKFFDSLGRAEAPSASATKEVTAIIGNNRKGQRERFRFLPGTFRFPDLVVDFQDIVQLPLTDVATEYRIASLDSPFAEALMAGFARYYGRLGTPDLDDEFVLTRLKTKAPKTGSTRD